MLGKVIPNSKKNTVVFMKHVLLKFNSLSGVRRFFSSFSLIHILSKLIFNPGKSTGGIHLERVDLVIVH
jgi:hypothetical protein